MPRPREEVLAELEAELAKIPKLPKPDLTRAVRLGLELGWPAEIVAETSQMVSRQPVLEVLRSTLFCPITNDEERFVQITEFGNCYLREFEGWYRITESIRQWRTEYCLVWPTEEELAAARFATIN